MAKNKKLAEKLRLYYRGRVSRPTRVASESDMQIIQQALAQCLPLRSKAAFMSDWPQSTGANVQANPVRRMRFRVHVGVSSALRLLKQRRTKAIIYDHSLNEHLIRYLIHFANELKCPTVQVKDVYRSLPSQKAKSVLIISFSDADQLESGLYLEKDPRPTPISETKESEAFNLLTQLLRNDHSNMSNQSQVGFQAPKLELVKSSGKSRAKKEARKASKARENEVQEQKISATKT